jgi:polyisoprenoid-binding protein YceI
VIQNLHCRPVALAALALLAAQPPTERFVITPGLSKASYAVDEVFLNENNRLFTAVGVTTAVTGEILLDRTQPARSRIGEVSVDLRELQSDSERRDRALRGKYLDTSRHPLARLTNSTINALPSRLVEGQPFHYTITGDLTVHGTTRRTTWHGQATLAGKTLRGSARAYVKMSEFGIEVPKLLSLRSEDDVIITIEYVATSDST